MQRRITASAPGKVIVLYPPKNLLAWFSSPCPLILTTTEQNTSAVSIRWCTTVLPWLAPSTSALQCNSSVPHRRLLHLHRRHACCISKRTPPLLLSILSMRAHWQRCLRRTLPLFPGHQQLPHHRCFLPRRCCLCCRRSANQHEHPSPRFPIICSRQHRPTTWR